MRLKTTNIDEPLWEELINLKTTRRDRNLRSTIRYLLEAEKGRLQKTSHIIITRAPCRISLGGGGSDLPSYSSKYHGFLVTGAINKYVYVHINKRFENSIRLSYSKTEIVDNIEEIRHPIFREVLKLLNIRKNLEIATMADIPANTGLGTSSSFTVALLNGLYTYLGRTISRHSLAEEACKVEIDLLKEPIGVQDQYAATFGGIIALDTNGRKVEVKPIELSSETISRLENNILLFFTGFKRKSGDVLKYQNNATKKNEEEVVQSLHKIKEIGIESKNALERGDTTRFGELLNEHWQTKLKLSSYVSNPKINKLCELGLKNGAVGSKLIGGGGGGFLMFYCEDQKEELRRAMYGLGLKEMHFKFDFEGAKIIDG